MVEIQQLAYDFLLQAHIGKLKLTMADFTQMCKRMDYTLLSYVQGREIIESFHLKGNMRYNGFAFVSGGHKMIFYKDALAYHEKLFTIAHEIGHIFLGHMYTGTKPRAAAEGWSDAQEQEADTFAYYLIAPPCILQACHVTTPAQLTQLTYLKNQRCAQAFMNLCNYIPTPEDTLLEASFSSFVQHNDFSKAAGTKPKRFKTLRRLWVVYSVMALTATGIWLSTKIFPQRVSHPVAIAPEDIVYITIEGDKYHRRDCYQIDDSQLLVISIEDAARLGYEPCKTCRPQK